MAACTGAACVICAVPYVARVAQREANHSTCAWEQVNAQRRTARRRRARYACRHGAYSVAHEHGSGGVKGASTKRMPSASSQEDRYVEGGGNV